MNDPELKFRRACNEVGILPYDQTALFAFLAPLREKDVITFLHYEHSLRVGLLARKIARHTQHDERALLMAGALHDLGKCQVCLATLGKTKEWTRDDTKEVMGHVLDGYRVLRGRFDLTAETIVRHHTFQADGYPKRPPIFLHAYGKNTKHLIAEHARIVALADVYDALHRVNNKYGAARELSPAEIKKLMIEHNADQEELVEQLYGEQVFQE